MDLFCRLPAGRAREANEHRRAPAFDPLGTVCLCHSFCRGRAPGLLAPLFAMALEILAGGGCSFTACLAANRVGILHVTGHGAAWSARKIVAYGVWAWTRVHICRLGDRVGAVQLAVWGATVDRKLLDASAVLGAGRIRTFRRVILPLSVPGIVTALVLSFAHTLGEFGVVLMVGGNLAGVTRTVSIDIYDRVQSL